ncbi:MAG: cytochrome P450 [Steroidobacteraceae bacterium]|nr:cytochrome P450 [Nevskiaceae bacterium]MCP5339832.1 cytochrome P450 [Nevskiaceae bacterium]MCP5359792.1 cytochrome P450 [Nevskiaceae bacterium]MCP5467411.1 cytochrome P450 [Nevskiaceae bacterium]MCP5472718.1 cytochrome P450 [Nevskiaceae bacterium]
MSASISFMDPEVQLCPFKAYDEVRGPAKVYQDPATGWYYVTDYETVRKLSADAANLSSFTGVLMCKTKSAHQDEIDAIWQSEGFLPTPVLVVSDPPDHAFYRSFVDRSFSPARVKRMEEYLEGIVDDIIAEHGGRDVMEFRSDVATRLTLSVIADQLGMPRSDWKQLDEWSDAVMAHQDQSIPPEKEKALVHKICELHQYAARKAEEYRREPRECLLSDFANMEVDGRRLTMREFAAMVEQGLTGGKDTSASAMCSAMLRLCEDPALQERLRADPALIPPFFEEVLRIDSPVQGLFREARSDLEVGGTRIPRGSVVVLKWGAANRDPAMFPEPDQLKLDRTNTRRHLTFGYGPHACVGNLLARAEARILFTKLLANMKNFRLADGPESVKRVPHFFSYGPMALHVRYESLPGAAS